MRTDRAGVREDIQEIKQRLTGLEVTVGGVKQDIGDLYAENAGQHIRYDRLAARIKKIE